MPLPEQLNKKQFKGQGNIKGKSFFEFFDRVIKNNPIVIIHTFFLLRPHPGFSRSALERL